MSFNDIDILKYFIRTKIKQENFKLILKIVIKYTKTHRHIFLLEIESNMMT